MTRHSTPKRLLNFGKDKVMAAVLDKLAPPVSADADPETRSANAALRAGLTERIGPMIHQRKRGSADAAHTAALGGGRRRSR